jgi:hypothetical protein
VGTAPAVQAVEHQQPAQQEGLVCAAPAGRYGRASAPFCGAGTCGRPDRARRRGAARNARRRERLAGAIRGHPRRCNAGAPSAACDASARQMQHKHTKHRR